VSPTGYLWIGYVLTWIAVGGYAWRLERRGRSARRVLRRARDEPRDTDGDS